MTELASLVLFSADYDRTVAFYRSLGVPLEHEDHDDGPAHHAVELGSVHVAVYPAASAGVAPSRRGGGSSFPGFYVDSLDEAADAVERLAAPLLQPHEVMPWGCRVVVADPDGRPVEINQREHCA